MFRKIDPQKRSHESPMDFEWQNKAPMDPTSPFALAKPQLQSAFEAHPQQSSFIAASSKAGTQFRNPSFTTPRKPFEPELFSEQSGVDSSPGETGDAEDTPDQAKDSQAMTVFSNGGTVRQPIFGKYGTDFTGTSPGHREQRRGKYGNHLMQKQKARKRKRIERDYGITKEAQYESDSDEDGARSKSRGGKDRSDVAAESSPGFLAQFFNYIESHPNLPNVLSYYAQLFVNFFLASLTVYGIFTMWITIRADVDKASESERAVLVKEMAICAKEFVTNGCSKAGRVPALDAPCNEWEHCMNQDPASVGRARISAHTFAEILNSFIEPISWKAMIFIAVIITLSFVVNNVAFGAFRSKHQQSFHPTPFQNVQQLFPQPSQSAHWAPFGIEDEHIPRTPRHQQNQYGGLGYGTPHGNNMIMATGTPGILRSPSKGDRERSMSPRKGRSPSKGY